MDKILKSKNELLLGLAGVVLLAFTVAVFSWGLGFLAINIGKAINAGSTQGTSANFDLNGAKQLNLKGLAR